MLVCIAGNYVDSNREEDRAVLDVFVGGTVFRPPIFVFAVVPVRVVVPVINGAGALLTGDGAPIIEPNLFATVLALDLHRIFPGSHVANPSGQSVTN